MVAKYGVLAVVVTSVLVGSAISASTYFGNGGSSPASKSAFSTNSYSTSSLGSTFSLSTSTYTSISRASATSTQSQTSNSSGSSSLTSHTTSVVTATIAGSVKVAPGPDWIAYDQRNELLYVTNGPNSNTLTIINVTSSSNRMDVVATIPLNSYGGQPIVDTSNGIVYVPSHSAIFVLNGTNISGMITNGYAGTTGWGAYDPDNEQIYVATSMMLPSYIAIQVFSTVSNSLVANITEPTQLGLSIQGLAYDSQNKLLYVSGSSYGVAILNTTNYQLQGTVQVQSNAIQVGEGDGLCVDDNTSLVYVADFADNQTIVFSSVNDSVVARIVGARPMNAAYDTRNGLVYIANALSNSVQVINGTKIVGTIPVGNFPWGLAYDRDTGKVYVTNRDSMSVLAIEVT